MRLNRTPFSVSRHPKTPTESKWEKHLQLRKQAVFISSPSLSKEIYLFTDYQSYFVMWRNSQTKSQDLSVHRGQWCGARVQRKIFWARGRGSRAQKIIHPKHALFNKGISQAAFLAQTWNLRKTEEAKQLSAPPKSRSDNPLTKPCCYHFI